MQTKMDDPLGNQGLLLNVIGTHVSSALTLSIIASLKAMEIFSILGHLHPVFPEVFEPIAICKDPRMSACPNGPLAQGVSAAVGTQIL